MMGACIPTLLTLLAGGTAEQPEPIVFRDGNDSIVAIEPISMMVRWRRRFVEFVPTVPYEKEDEWDRAAFDDLLDIVATTPLIRVGDFDGDGTNDVSFGLFLLPINNRTRCLARIFILSGRTGSVLRNHSLEDGRLSNDQIGNVVLGVDPDDPLREGLIVAAPFVPRGDSGGVGATYFVPFCADSLPRRLKSPNVIRAVGRNLDGGECFITVAEAARCCRFEIEEMPHRNHLIGRSDSRWDVADPGRAIGLDEGCWHALSVFVAVRWDGGAKDHPEIDWVRRSAIDEVSIGPAWFWPGSDEVDSAEIVGLVGRDRSILVVRSFPMGSDDEKTVAYGLVPDSSGIVAKWRIEDVDLLEIVRDVDGDGVEELVGLSAGVHMDRHAMEYSLVSGSSGARLVDFTIKR